MEGLTHIYVRRYRAEKMVVSLKAKALPNLMIQQAFLGHSNSIKGERRITCCRRERERDRERHEPTVDTTLTTLEWKKKTEAVYHPMSIDR